MGKNEFHEKAFDESTRLKLEIFRECFKEWFPVFIFTPYIKKIFIYDFFAGRGKDCKGNLGSPLILLSEAKGTDCSFCKPNNNKDVIFAFNDKTEKDELKNNVDSFIEKCKTENCNKDKCIYQIYFGNYEFKNIFENQNFKDILNHKDYAKFILLDQFGFSQVDETVFKELVMAPNTDFIFFIASSFIDRFKTHPSTKKYIDTTRIDFDGCEPRQRHGLIAEYFEQLIGTNEYYIHNFTIKKGSNYYGLIFGSKHTLGMEKFLKVCWSKDKYSGESSEAELYNHDFSEGSMFFIENSSKKIENVKALIRDRVLNGEIQDNISGLKFALKHRCLPKVFNEVLKDMEKKDEIKRIGDVNNSSTGIHRIKKYSIERISQ